MFGGFYSSLGQVLLTSLYQIGEVVSSIFDAKFHIIATRFHITAESVSDEVKWRARETRWCRDSGFSWSETEISKKTKKEKKKKIGHTLEIHWKAVRLVLSKSSTLFNIWLGPVSYGVHISLNYMVPVCSCCCQDGNIAAC